VVATAPSLIGTAIDDTVSNEELKLMHGDLVAGPALRCLHPDPRSPTWRTRQAAKQVHAGGGMEALVEASSGAVELRLRGRLLEVVQSPVATGGKTTCFPAAPARAGKFCTVDCWLLEIRATSCFVSPRAPPLHSAMLALVCHGHPSCPATARVMAISLL